MNQATSQWSQFKQGIHDCIPTIIGYVSIGLAFGVVGSTSNLTVLEVFLLASVLYAGSAQFIFCSLIVVNAPFFAIVATIFVVNFRHFLMSLSIAPYFKSDSILRNIGYGTLLTDESFGVAIVKGNKEGSLNGNWLNGLNVTAYLSWIMACVGGSLIGAYIQSPEVYGLDYALVAMFIALLILTLQSLPKTRLLHYIKVIVCVFLLMAVLIQFIPGHLAVLISTMVAATIGVMMK
jgi:4-azaleucine resistance transporter AzlC